jgi:hypothetical protein
MRKSIWVLFSIANEYDQPDNNLEAWWFFKPSFTELAKGLVMEVDIKKGNSYIGKILKGEKVRMGEYDYRLREIEEGKIKEDY